MFKRRHSAIHAHRPGDDAQDLDLVMAQIERLHVGIGRLQADTVGLDIETLQRHPLAIDQGDDGLAVLRRLTLLDDDEGCLISLIKASWRRKTVSNSYLDGDGVPCDKLCR